MLIALFFTPKIKLKRIIIKKIKKPRGGLMI